MVFWGVNVIPTEKQWTKIKDRVSEITETATSYPIFVDRHVKPYPPYWSNPYWCGTSWGGLLGNAGSAESMTSLNAVGFNSNEAFNQLGKIEFEMVKYS